MVDWDLKIVTYADSLVGRQGSVGDETRVKQETLTLLGLMQRKPRDINLREWRWVSETVSNCICQAGDM